MVTTKISVRIPEDLVEAAKKAAGDAGLSAFIEDSLRDYLAVSEKPSTVGIPSATLDLDLDLNKRLAGLTDQVDQLKSSVESLGNLKGQVEEIGGDFSAVALNTAQVVDSTRDQFHEMTLMLALFAKPLGLDHLDLFKGMDASAGMPPELCETAGANIDREMRYETKKGKADRSDQHRIARSPPMLKGEPKDIHLTRTSEEALAIWTKADQKGEIRPTVIVTGGDGRIATSLKTSRVLIDRANTVTVHFMAMCPAIPGSSPAPTRPL
ncbi:hypothetical protein [Hydrogenophaga sp. 2FB]|uniref:hypothetical protein n=1 Tax=Hydrogenophaga sp. 2FB TaxID=2502187 RepID=UPI0010F9316D|nr:hypothetical protein [Hydrogenophaga sp. 2FB]